MKQAWSMTIESWIGSLLIIVLAVSAMVVIWRISKAAESEIDLLNMTHTYTKHENYRER